MRNWQACQVCLPGLRRQKMQCCRQSLCSLRWLRAKQNPGRVADGSSASCSGVTAGRYNKKGRRVTHALQRPEGLLISCIESGAASAYPKTLNTAIGDRLLVLRKA